MTVNTHIFFFGLRCVTAALLLISQSTLQMKEDVQLGMREDRIRLFIATEAYSMGTDSPDIRKIIHFGVPYTLESKRFKLK